MTAQPEVIDPFAEPVMHPVAVQFNAIRKYLASIFFERNSAIEACLLAILSKEHVYLLGPPGTGKSDMIRLLISCIKGDYNYFEALLSRTRADSAILGPYDLPKLRDKGDHVRKTKGFLPESTFTFLDEVGKMGPTLGHDMLAILNERIYHEVTADGQSSRPVPLHTAFTAANEMIVDESDDAAALWDRLLIRDVVDYIQESSNFAKFLLSQRDSVEQPFVSFSDLQDVVENVIPNIPIPKDVALAVIRLRDELRAKEITLSDRRWGWSMRVLQASAFLNGQPTVSEDDIAVLRYTLWDTITQIKDVQRLTISIANPMMEKVSELMDQAEEMRRKIESMTTEAETAKGQYGAEVNGKLKRIQNDLKTLHDECIEQGRSAQKVLEAKERVQDIADLCYVNLLGMSPEKVKNSRMERGN
jgi:MoxR-like ATPase